MARGETSIVRLPEQDVCFEATVDRKVFKLIHKETGISISTPAPETIKPELFEWYLHHLTEQVYGPECLRVA